MALSTESVFDEGLQAERTALSWQRTLLSLAVGSLAASRGLEILIGPAAWAVAAVGLSLTIAAFVVTRKRYVQAHNHLTKVDAHSLPHSAALITVTAAVTIGIGFAALAFVVHQLM